MEKIVAKHQQPDLPGRRVTERARKAGRRKSCKVRAEDAWRHDFRRTPVPPEMGENILLFTTKSVCEKPTEEKKRPTKHTKRHWKLPGWGDDKGQTGINQIIF